MSRHHTPTPSPKDPYSTTFTNLNDWIVSDWGAPMGGTFDPTCVSLNSGMLALRLTQSLTNGNIRSIGGEVQLKRLCGFGDYTWVARVGSTAPAPNANGQIVSGSISGMFPFVNNSETELDIEIEGQYPNQVDFTTWHTTAVRQTTVSPNVNVGDGAFHTFKMQWRSGAVSYSVDGKMLAQHAQSVPQAPAYPMINFWGTNTTDFGGKATPGVTRAFYVKSFSYVGV